MIRGMHHIAISTHDLDRAINFYRDLLNFEVIGDYFWQEGEEIVDRIMQLDSSSGRYAMLKTRNMMLEIFQFQTPSPKAVDKQRSVSDFGYTHISLDVTDIDSEYERLSKAGMVFHCPPLDVEDGKFRCTYGRDPDGNVIELQEILDQDNPEMLSWE